MTSSSVISANLSYISDIIIIIIIIRENKIQLLPVNCHTRHDMICTFCYRESITLSHT